MFSHLRRFALALFSLAVLLGACDGKGAPPTCMISIGSCEGPECGIDYGRCSDDMKREIKCAPATEPPFKCECIENDVKKRDVELEIDPYKIGLDGAPATAKSACGWDVR